MTKPRSDESGLGILGIGAIACAACCAGPILAFLGAVGAAGIAGIWFIGAGGLAVAAVSLAIYLALARRGRAGCAPRPSGPVAVKSPSRKPVPELPSIP